MRPRVYALALAFALLAACGDSGVATNPPPPDVTDVGGDKAPPLDVAPDVVADVVVDAPSIDADVVPLDTPPLDAPEVAADTTPAGCRTDMDCVDHELGRVCDTASGRCVPCTATNRGSCAPTEYCAASLRCETGCAADADCASTAATPRCDVTAHRCVACTADAQCAGATNATARCAEARCTVVCTTGFADCDGVAATGCEVDTRTSATHCNGCGRACPTAPNAAPTCDLGMCGITCDAGFANCDGDAANGCEVDTRSSASHCGACGTVCAAGANAAPSCQMGTCRPACLDGFADCDGVSANGCEVALSGTANCGRCGNACTGATPLCAEGERGVFACSSGCVAGQARCGSSCVDTADSIEHCGACGNACARRPNARPACAMGTCAIACEADFGDCDRSAANGCEVITASDVRHCGRCGNACATGPHASATCEGGRCGLRCDAGFEDCDGDPANGCEADLVASTTHCGRCGNACPSGPEGSATCAAGRCGLRCNAGRGDCDGNPANGCETDLNSSASHCARCGNACVAGANAAPTCAMGVCGSTCADGFADCDGLTATGCEASLRGTANCGRCSNACTAKLPVCAVTSGTPACASGCAASEVRCGGSCVTTATSVDHCGACGNACPAVSNGSRTCTAGACGLACAAGFADCDASAATGCEVDTRVSVAHCGACGRRCPTPARATPTCSASACGFTCEAGFADCDGVASNGCEVDLRTSATACGACGTSCGTGRCEDSRCVSNRSCAEILRSAPSSLSGNYTIDPDGAGGRSPYTVYCDMVTEGGGWTVIFQPATSNYADLALDYTVQDPSLMAASTRALMAYRNGVQATYPNWASFALPAAWRLQSPFRYPGNDETVLVVINGAAPVSAILRYGYQTYSQRCTDPWVTSGNWGRLCIAGTNAAFYSGHVVTYQDTCANSDQVWSASNCSDSLRFTLAVR